MRTDAGPATTQVIGDVVVFSLEDYELVEKIARDRWEGKKRNGVRDQTRWDKGTAVANLIGVLGELAFGLWAKLVRPISHDWGSLRGDGGVDGRLKDGRRYQVKASPHARAALVFGTWNAIGQTEVLVLATVDVENLARRVSLRGWIDSIRFRELAEFGKPVSNFPGEVYFVLQEQLEPMGTLLHGSTQKSVQAEATS